VIVSTTARTPFDRPLRALGAEFVEFGGWYWCASVGDPVQGHFAVRNAVGVWDQSALPKWRVEGPEAIDALDLVFTNRLRDLEAGRVRYSPFCNADGRMISDATIYMFSATEFWVMPTLESDLDFVRDLVSHLEVGIESFTAELGLLDLQGPRSRELLAGLCARDVSDLAYFRFWPEEVDVAGVPCWVSRTGYSGELGFELMCRPEHAEQLWERLLATGEVTPYGLSAVESIRIESGLLFIGIDYTPYETSPLDLSLDRFIAVDKGPFNGRDALAASFEEPPRRLCTLTPASDRAPAYGSAVMKSGARVGTLTSACVSPTFDRVIGLAVLDRSVASVGEEVEVMTGDGPIAAQVAPLPLYDTDRKRPRS
jgi:aminomethyltransferase